MPQHASAIKRVRQNAARRLRNREHRSRMRTMVKKIMQTDDASTAQSLYPETQAYLDRLATKGIIHRNKSARYKVQILRHMDKINQSF
ncbi:MAG: 30S ribosomal protein S20 [Rhodothermaceae bacterium]|nr:30S ribosomal protein S20 [Rhodothermaceae bacterium]MXX57960.1 30S ribosomal protein S20 [Rhodothermaceae bacterium]MXZ04422.1 30S ribosomal protein S20 [Rhodothermaceae bacterium]MYD19962.1 30S ribosomal protein S20 [Rhodothermaceae bacterium]MYD56173.1 30S ribosomal protein S20 [Rhodothermaceae bacterium]